MLTQKNEKKDSHTLYIGKKYLLEGNLTLCIKNLKNIHIL